MKKIEYDKDLENKYLEAFKNEIKSLNLKWQDLKKSNNQLKDFPDKVEDILIADFNHLLDWYFEYLDK
ncbi:MAG: hypothetical protein HUK24_06710 [Sphaerochaetaceae bacterium]|nr:hypothetical protein [Sphaerochaetaceae bacterium]